MSIQLFSCLLVCFSGISLQSAETKQKKPISTFEQFKAAVSDMRKPVNPNHVSFINSSQSSPAQNRADCPKDKQGT